MVNQSLQAGENSGVQPIACKQTVSVSNHRLLSKRDIESILKSANVWMFYKVISSGLTKVLKQFLFWFVPLSLISKFEENMTRLLIFCGSVPSEVVFPQRSSSFQHF